jgi:hypothetical protein
VTAKQVSVGLVTSLTGLAAANFTGAEQGAAARFALQNAAGGVDGRIIKMTVADDQSSPTGAQTAVSSPASGTFGQVFISDFTTQAYRTTSQAKIRVVGAPDDGPERGEQPNTAVRGGQGAIFDLPQAPVESNTPATRAETAAFAKYEHFTGVPSFNWSYGWLSADLFIRGLEAAGKNLTRASFIAKIRTVSWDGGGLLPRPVDVSLAGFGKAPATSCAYFAQLKGSTFVPMNGGKPYCGRTLGS